MLKSELIDNFNLEEAVKVQNAIFPRENGRINFLESIENAELPIKTEGKNVYYLVRNELGQSVGIWGYYVTPILDECWLGWFGVLNEFRKIGYGSEIFKIFENFAKVNGFKTIRLYTDEIDNADACRLYEKNGMTKEYYQNENDITEEIGKILIYSKSLTGEKVTLWNNRFLNLKSQVEKEKFD